MNQFCKTKLVGWPKVEFDTAQVKYSVCIGPYYIKRNVIYLVIKDK